MDTCKWEISKGNVCGQEAVAVVTFVDRVARGHVPVCDIHHREHKSRAAHLRVKMKAESPTIQKG